MHCENVFSRTSIGSGLGIGRYLILDDSDWGQKNLVGASLVSSVNCVDTIKTHSKSNTVSLGERSRRQH